MNPSHDSQLPPDAIERLFGDHVLRLSGRFMDNEPVDRLEADEILRRIRLEKGYLDPTTIADLASIRAQSRDNVMQIIEQKKETEAAYTRNISEQLYSSKYRFLYELIQNADDASYENAGRRDVNPSLAFTMNPHSIIIDTNEDGFTRKNIEAICATGKSSKKIATSDAHIGEKGFGFKSVFAVASKVHIQSGLWSFQFKHQRGDNGLGMVTPLTCHASPLPKGTITRIVLTLPSNPPVDYERLVEAVIEMPTTTIFYLQKLKQIQFNISRGARHPETITIMKLPGPEDGMVTIQRSHEMHDAEEIDESAYYTIKRRIAPMPVDDRRKDLDYTRIELAFPVEPPDMKPKESELGQWVFAYLPVQRLPHIQFLIQADFITSASRETIVDCPWNDAICDHVGSVFARAIESFATSGHPLKHEWVQYLPTKPMQHPWKRLYSSITKRLRTSPVLESWRDRTFKTPGMLRLIPDVFISQGRPLFQDFQEEIFLAPEYAKLISMEVLHDLGVNLLSWEEILRLIQADLISTKSRIRDLENNTWQKAFAHLGLRLLSYDDPAQDQLKATFKRSAIIPLSRRNQWTGAPEMGKGGLTKIYFPCTGSIPIPDDIGLHLLAPDSCHDPYRKRFYKALGVRECPISIILEKIQESHEAREFSNIGRHLSFLFRAQVESHEYRGWLLIPTDDNRNVSIREKIFFPSDNEYHMDQLIPRELRDKLNCTLNFLPRDLIDLEPSNTVIEGKTWKEWLQLVTKARFAPALGIKINGSEKATLSKDLQLVLEHCPLKFLRTLQTNWKFYEQNASRIKEDLKNRQIICRSGETERLASSYLPTSEVISEMARLGLGISDHKILHISDSFEALDDITHRQWRFLEEFGVRSKPDYDFYFTALNHFRDGGDINKFQIQETYRSLARHSTIEKQASLSLTFRNEDLIWTPFGCWISGLCCVWRGPNFLQYLVVLESIFSDDPLIESFFTNLLEIPDCTAGHVVDDLVKWSKESQDQEEQSEDETSNHAVIDGSSEQDAEIQPDDENRESEGGDDMWLANQYYTYINAHTRQPDEWANIRKKFENNDLILSEDGAEWLPISACVWKSPFPLAGLFDLHKIYPDLEVFFVQRLGVKRADLIMLVKEVIRMVEKDEPEIEDIKERLIEIGMMLADGALDSNAKKTLDRLKAINFLPKRLPGGELTLVGLGDDFTILDHSRYGRALVNACILLDFNIEESLILDVMFRHLGCTHRYLSMAVSEESSIGDDASVDDVLTKNFSKRSFALYCCAAKHKSRKALRGEQILFNQLETTVIYTTDTLSTDLVVQLSTGPFRVQSDRSFLHHQIVNGELKLYVPRNVQQRRACYRTQLPTLLTSIIGTSRDSIHDISVIINCGLIDLNDILLEQDIPEVTWIEKTGKESEQDLEDEENNVLSPILANMTPSLAIPISHPRNNSHPQASNQAVLLPSSGHSRSHGNDYQVENLAVALGMASITSTPPPMTPVIAETVHLSRQYQYLIDQVIWIARHRSISRAYTVTERRELLHFDPETTFGIRGTNDFAYNRRIGAIGEAYVFEWLSSLEVPRFSYNNWQSTIRGVLNVHPQYAALESWAGSETADIVCTDYDGSLTKHLRNVCEGGFPPQIPEDFIHELHPITYYLEVKTTPGPCNTRFYMSTAQYQRMNVMSIGPRSVPKNVYVIIRVFNLVTPDVGMKIFVDPLRLRGSSLHFEAEKWLVNTI